ncbi:hypothetical protein Tco_0817151, partial [Tanacetum coccineum]
ADSESMEEDSIDYPYEPEDGDEDSEENPEEDHTYYPTDGEDGDDEPSDDDDDDDDTDDGNEEPPAQKTVKLEPPMSASKEALIAKHAVIPIQPTSPTYDQAPLGHRAAMIRIRDDIPEEDMPPQRRFVLTAPPPGCDIAKSSVAAARPPRGQYDFVDTVEAGQASEHMMMTSIDEVNLRVSYQAQVRRQENADFHTQLLDARTDRKDIRLEIDVVRGQRTAYETELSEVRQAYLSSEARNRALLARLETLKTYMSRMEWQRQRAEDDAVRQMIRIHVLEARAQIDTVEDTDSSCVVGLSQWLEKMESVFHISGCGNENQVKFATCTLLENSQEEVEGQILSKRNRKYCGMIWKRGFVAEALWDDLYTRSFYESFPDLSPDVQNASAVNDWTWRYRWESPSIVHNILSKFPRPAYHSSMDTLVPPETGKSISGFIRKAAKIEL